MELNFRDELGQTPINVPRAALVFAKEIAYPELDVQRYLAQLDQLADWARVVITPGHTAIVRAKALSDFLFRRFGFRGNSAEYDDPRNSFLNEVLDRQTGIPISLSVIYIAVARQLGLAAEGVGLPGHFIVSIREAAGDFYLDPFNAGRWLTIEDCAQLVAQSSGYQGSFNPEWLQPVSPQAILARMLGNLRRIYLQRQAWASARLVIERQQFIPPGSPEFLRDLGLIYQQSGALRLAAHYYERYLLALPDAPDAERVRQILQVVTRRLAQLN